jgi:transposase
MSTPSIHNLDHLGLVAGMCRELRIADIIDAVIPKHGEHAVTHGQTLVAMLINGLGFHSGTLHMFSEFFANKPTERLIGPGIEARHLTDDVLGRCLDSLYEVGVCELYQVIAEQVVGRLGLGESDLHLDITSFHVDGRYAGDEEDDVKRLRLVKGYSRDHRPELNQVVLEMMCENQAGIPVFMQALNGNSNDQKSFAEVSRLHLKSLKAAQNSNYLVGDAALYTEESIQALHEQGQHFVTRVPMTLKDAREAVCTLQSQELKDFGDGYSGQWLTSEYAGVQQRWLLVRSEQATAREEQTVLRRIEKDRQADDKALKRFFKQRFACEADARQALEVFSSSLKVSVLSSPQLVTYDVFARPGRPKKDESPIRQEYGFTSERQDNEAILAQRHAQAGVFILATNDMDGDMTMASLLAIYKQQQRVERGFRFLKSPDFLTSALFLKKPERIEALLMVMTCTLMIYAALEHRIRQELRSQNQTFPDMKNKPTQTPTARWVFIKFMGIHELILPDGPPMITGTKDCANTVIQILGETYEQIYS